MIAAMIPLVFTSLLVTVSAFHINQKFRPLSRNVFPLFDSEINNERVDGYDPGEFEQIFKVLNPEINNKNKTNKIDNGIVSESEDGSTKEELFRKYPFENLELPILTDCNNYYSGKYEDSFWLQNSDQVFVYIPIVDDIPARDISVKFEVKRVDIKIKGEAKTVFCSERIIPDGSFWTMETDKNGVRYLQLDLEKRYAL